MAFFDNDEPEDFLLFISNFCTTLKASVTLVVSVNIQYLCTLVRGEVLRQFEMLSSKGGSITPENLKSIILGLGT